MPDLPNSQPLEDARTAALDEIWADDRLKRRAEADILERFLLGEARAQSKASPPRSLVLGLDAGYGEGKTWFLTRLRKQLELRHHVAFIDAWIDDAGGEPLVSLMSAIQDIVAPLRRKRQLMDRFASLTKAALPLIGKGAVGAATALTKRHLGEEFGAAAGAALAGSTTKVEKPSDVETVADKMAEGLGEVVDASGKALIDQYQARRRSRSEFRKALGQIVQSLGSGSAGARSVPLFIFIDELDRCRPDYALTVLEEVKHLFDIPNIVFVMALNADQLRHSVAAVYGPTFDGSSYLRRFFTRTYRLRRLSLTEFVEDHFREITPPTGWTMPEVQVAGEYQKPPPAWICGELLTDWGLTPREVLSTIDALRVFVDLWSLDAPVELPLVLVMLANFVRNGHTEVTLSSLDNIGKVGLKTLQKVDDFNSRLVIRSSSDLIQAYSQTIGRDLSAFSRNTSVGGFDAHFEEVFRTELQRLHHGRYNPQNPPMPSWSLYKSTIEDLRPLVTETVS